MAKPISQPPTRPAKDEWGVYDPEQAGLAALFARLDARNPTVSERPKAAATAVVAEHPSLRDTQ